MPKLINNSSPELKEILGGSNVAPKRMPSSGERPCNGKITYKLTIVAFLNAKLSMWLILLSSSFLENRGSTLKVGDSLHLSNGSRTYRS